MTFLTPALLALGLAATVPLALHLLQRHQGPRLLFPALRYLRRAERERATRLRLRQVALLALRVLAILLLAAAAARPFLATGGRDHHPTSVVIVLDNSLTSGAVIGDRRVLDHLADAALAAVAAAGPDDRLWLIRAGEPWEPALTGPPTAVAAAIRATDPAATAADLGAQVERAASIIAAASEDRAAEIHLLSSLGRGSFRPGAAPARAPTRVLVLDPPADLIPNRGVTAVEVAGGIPPLAGEPTTVTATVGGAVESGEGGSLDVRLVVDGRVMSVAQATAGSAASLPVPERRPGLFTGRVEIDPDRLSADDRRYFVTEVRRPPVVGLTAPAPFVEEALEVLEQAGRSVRGTGQEGAVVIAPGAIGADAVRRGASVIVLPPTSPVELGATNQRLAGAGIPWRLGAPSDGEARLEAGGSGVEALLHEARLRRIHPLEPSGEPTDTVLLRLRTGEPWAIAGRTETGRYVLLASPLTADAGAIATSVAMVPLLDLAVNAWAVAGAVHHEHHPGSEVVLPPGDSIVRPDGTAEAVRRGAPYRLTSSGIYRVLAEDTVTAAYAVNPPAAASDTRRLPPSDIAALLPGHEVRIIGTREWAASIYHRRRGRDVSGPLLLAALLFLLAEAGLAAAGRAAGRRPGATARPPAAGAPA
jgi:hypothetical protein